MPLKFNNPYVKKYKNDGFVIIKNLINKKEAKVLEKQVFKFIKKKIKNYDGRDINFTSSQKNIKTLHSFHKLHDSKKIVNFSKNKKITSIAKSLIKTKNLELRASEFFAKPKKTGLNIPQ